ncbi:MAG: deoxyribonuclease IV [FCB group bacterium]|nr:deoxyribonuclease IV [FCB group bacterium]
MTKSNRPFLGAHVSVAGGVEKAPQRGHDLTCECIQIFSKNQNQWKAKPLTDDSIARFKAGIMDFDIKSVLIHDSYLINLAGPDQQKLTMSMDAFIDEIDRADQLGVEQLVFHPGSHMGEGEESGLRKIAENLNRVINLRPDSRVKLLLENTAGQGTNLGFRFEHLAVIIDLVEDKSRMGVCFDTAHALAAGFDLREKEKYLETWNSFDDIIGLEYLSAFHLNDSKKDLAARVDRHENIGGGFVGTEMFRLLVNDERFAGLGMYLETPGGDEAYLNDLQTLRSLFE